jgi:tRNA(Arg) A34 adenosine deaminase TadA
MWSALAEPWRVCLEEAWAAYAAGSVPIGSAIADDTGRIVARGRNRAFEPWAGGREIAGNRLAHAEMNALNLLDPASVDPGRCTLYTTTEPCPLCTGAIRMVGIGHVAYASADSGSGGLTLFAATPFMQRGQPTLTGPQDKRLETLIVALHVAFALAPARRAEYTWLIAARSETQPLGVDLGRRLDETGLLRNLHQQGATGAQMVEQITALL